MEGKVLAVYTQRGHIFVGKEIMIGGEPVKGFIINVAQIVTQFMNGPTGPVAFTIGLKLGEMLIPEDSIVVTLTDEKGPFYKEWHAQWFEEPKANVLPFTGRPPIGKGN